MTTVPGGPARSAPAAGDGPAAPASGTGRPGTFPAASGRDPRPAAPAAPGKEDHDAERSGCTPRGTRSCSPGQGAPAPARAPGDLTARLFRALYPGYDLHTVAGVHIAVPAGVPCFAGTSLGAIARRISAAPALRGQPGQERAGPAAAIAVPAPADAARLSRFLREHPGWSVFWDKRHALWRAAEDDPGSALYAESPDLDTILGYITARA